MKKWICMVSFMCMCVGIVSGCGSSAIEGDTSAVYVDKKGRISSLDVEELGEGFYNEEELETFIGDAVTEYTEEHGKNSVTMEDLTVEDGIAKLSMRYQSAQDYANFLDVEFFSGELLAALEAGYIFEGDFARVEGGQVVGAATKQEIYADQGLKVVIIRANTDVQVAGSSCYGSCENVRLDGANRVSIRDGYFLDNGASHTEVIPGVVDPDGTEEADAGDTETMDAGAEEADAGEESAAKTETAWVYQPEPKAYTFIVYR